jgi:hypothetical protein
VVEESRGTEQAGGITHVLHIIAATSTPATTP